VKQKITECKFHNKLLTVVEQHIIVCFQDAFLWLCNMHQDELAMGQLPDQRHFAGYQTTLQSEAASVHQRSVVTDLR